MQRPDPSRIASRRALRFSAGIVQYPFPATKKKPAYPVGPLLRAYLTRYAREVPLPVSYTRLLDFAEAAPVIDADGNDTLWQSVIYRPHEQLTLMKDLTYVYAILKAAGNRGLVEHLYVDRIDYCTFGNSNPFRVRIVNSHNHNQDYFYVKQADASRVYGLELEHLLSPFRLHYFTNNTTLIEEHIIGLPGDVFVSRWLHDPSIKTIRLAKELVKFNERCFVRLLGDMRAYNFVVDITPDVEEAQVRIRGMDFDQQSYSGRKNFYLPQFFKENLPLVQHCLDHLDQTTANQYKKEELSDLQRRMADYRDRLGLLLDCMEDDTLSTPEKIELLRVDLAEHWQHKAFLKAESMGALVRLSLRNVGRVLAADRKDRSRLPFAYQ
ncbi:MAG: hypothetical protein ACFE0O_05465 [Opitutales bacterium]